MTSTKPFPMPSRTTYTGSRTKLVLAFDVGTTYSGISYSILEPGQVPQIKSVTRFPAQTTSIGSSKIPTTIYYDQSGNVQAIGAEASRDGISEAAEEGRWVKAEWFKLHLNSAAISPYPPVSLDLDLPALPPKKPVVQIFADFLRYLFACAAKYIQDSHANGATLWASLKDNIDFVLSHPNGWGGKEQTELRRAAALGGLISDEVQKNQDRISFVAEGEASLHFVVECDVLSSVWKNGEGVVIVDAGGGTVDLSSYRRISNPDKPKFEEIAVPQCLLSGSVLVNLNLKTLLQDHLKESPYLEDIDHIIKCFDKSTKLTFKDEGDVQYVKFGSIRDNDLERGIRHGQLKLPGIDVAKLFKPCATALKQSILQQRRTTTHNITHIVMVGGFSMNDWLFHDISAFMGRVDPKLNVVRPEEQSHKAVSHGAVAFYLDRLVQTRMAKSTYGALCSVEYDAENSEHAARSSTKFVAESGETRIPDMFCTILPKNMQVSETREFRRSFNQISVKKSTFKALSTAVWCYRGTLARPRWKDIDSGSYYKLCTVVMDLSHLPKDSLTGSTGRLYYRVDYEIVLLFGLTELKAQIAWKENGFEKRSDAQIVYED